MLSQSQPIPCNRLTSPIVHRTSGPKKVNVYFTYQTSPHQSLKQSLTMIKQQQQQKHRKPIFQSRRKLSFKSIESKKRSSRLKIFQEASKKPTTLQSHIFLKESHVSKGSSPQTIVDQLEKLEQQTNLVNPITRKLSQMKNRNGTKGTFYSNTEKNSMMFTQRPQLRRNRIQSQVLHYQYSPMKKNRSSVTIKATKENRQYGVSKFSNGLSIITNQDDNMFEGFRDCGEVETPKYHRSTYRAMKRSFDPGLFVDHERKEEVKKVSEVHPQQHTDRFYDQSSLQTPRLPTVSKKISYQVINPLTSSLRQQKLQKKKQRQSLIQQASAKKQNKLKTLLLIVITMISSFITTSTAKVSHLIRKSINFTHSQTFFMIVIITLSLAVFVVQLVQ